MNRFVASYGSLAALFATVVCSPVLAAAENRCPWLNNATAAGVLGGPVEATVTPASCEFIRQTGGHSVFLRIEVAPATAPPARCGPDAEPLKGIGNQAVACSYAGKPGSITVGEQVVGKVRDQAFLVRMGANDRSMAKALRENTRKIAEQVAGILF